LIRETFAVGVLHCNCTILGDELSREAIIVDPGDELPKILSVLAKHRLTVKRIVVTHAHIDHIAGAQRLKEITGAPVLYNQADLALVVMMPEQAAWIGLTKAPDVREPDEDLADGLKVEVTGLSATAIHTPGHTPGSVCLYLATQGLLIAGDTLFAGSVGRTDLPGGNGPQLLRSIHDRLMGLPESTLVIPGHGAFTLIGSEREENPFLAV
jgi:glyoxylase-like metal-dependent hydrolase (beta-lactamase superfamily II)